MSKYTKETFAIAYSPLKADLNISDIERAKRLGLSSPTFYKYKKDYDATLSKLNSPNIVSSTERSEKIIDLAYKLHEKGIAEAIKANRFEEARDISIEALKIARTEAEIKRVFAAVHVDARVQTVVVQAEPNALFDRISEYSKTIKTICPKCGEVI